MSSLIFLTEQDQAVIATDTLAVSTDGRPFTFTSKALHLPHLKFVVAGTGCGGFLDRWLLHINTSLIVPGIEVLNIHAPAVLPELWETFRKEHAFPKSQTTTVYHFGFSEQTNLMKAFAYRSENNFAAEERPYGIGVKPECTVPDPYNFPADLRTMMDEQRRIQSAKPRDERLYIGGEIIVHHLVQGGCSTFSIGHFDDYLDDFKIIHSLT